MMPAALSGGGRLDVGRRRHSLARMRRSTLGVLPVVGLVMAGVVSAAAPGAATVDEKAERGQAMQVGEPPPRPPVPAEALQAKINELFTPYGTAPLTVDGDLGRYTRQRVCAFRLAAGLPVSTNPIAPGSAEEDLLMSMTTLPTPFTSPPMRSISKLVVWDMSKLARGPPSPRRKRVSVAAPPSIRPV